jgi:DNA-binding HxlR family transcriptional regulator
LIREFADTTALRPNWVEPLQKYRVDWTLMPTGHRLNLALAAWGRWSCVHSDEVAMIWRRIE